MAFNTFSDLTAPTCSTPVQWGALAADQSCIVVPLKSQINRLLMILDGDDPVDWTGAPTLTYDATLVDNTLTDNSKAKLLYGKGSVEIINETTVIVHDGIEVVTSRTWQLSFTPNNLDDDMYDFVRQAQFGDTNPKIGYSDRGAKFYGKPGGLSIKSIRPVTPNGGGEEDVKEATIIITWEALIEPRRGDSPLP